MRATSAKIVRGWVANPDEPVANGQKRDGTGRETFRSFGSLWWGWWRSGLVRWRRRRKPSTGLAEKGAARRTGRVRADREMGNDSRTTMGNGTRFSAARAVEIVAAAVRRSDIATGNQTYWTRARGECVRVRVSRVLYVRHRCIVACVYACDVYACVCVRVRALATMAAARVYALLPSRCVSLHCTNYLGRVSFPISAVFECVTAAVR